MSSPGGANRIELESQILSSALRQSWADTDAVGVVKACQELYQLYPDLLPLPKGEQTPVVSTICLFVKPGSNTIRSSQRRSSSSNSNLAD